MPASAVERILFACLKKKKKLFFFCERQQQQQHLTQFDLRTTIPTSFFSSLLYITHLQKLLFNLYASTSNLRRVAHGKCWAWEYIVSRRERKGWQEDIRYLSLSGLLLKIESVTGTRRGTIACMCVTLMHKTHRVLYNVRLYWGLNCRDKWLLMPRDY